MILEVIPPGKWPSFLEYFSELHKELLFSIEILDGGQEVSAGDHIKFSAITISDDKKRDLSIIGYAGDLEICHLIKNIRQICTGITNKNGNSALLIESAANFITSLNFEASESSPG